MLHLVLREERQGKTGCRHSRVHYKSHGVGEAYENEALALAPSGCRVRVTCTRKPQKMPFDFISASWTYRGGGVDLYRKVARRTLQKDLADTGHIS